MLAILLPKEEALRMISEDVENVFVHPIGSNHKGWEFGGIRIRYKCVLLFICDELGRLLLLAKKDCLIACFDSLF